MALRRGRRQHPFFVVARKPGAKKAHPAFAPGSLRKLAAEAAPTAVRATALPRRRAPLERANAILDGHKIHHAVVPDLRHPLQPPPKPAQVLSYLTRAVSGKKESVRLKLGGRRIIKKTTTTK